MASTENEEVIEKPVLKSVDSVRQSFVRFINRTSRCVDCIWINYEGRRVKYRTLKPNEFLDVNTFVSHPWIFRDSQTHGKMCVTMRLRDQTDLVDSEVFMPPDSNLRTRRVVYITIPIFTLKELCFQFLRTHLNCDIKMLEIPLTLKYDYTIWAKTNF